MTNEIILSDALDELLRWIAEALAGLPEGPRKSVAGVNQDGGDFIEIGGQRRPIQYSDLEELKAKGLVSYTERSGTGVSSRPPVAERVAITAEGQAWVAADMELSVLLTEGQTELLIMLVEEARRISGGQQYQFSAYDSPNGGIIMIEKERNPVFLPDLYELDRKGLINLREDDTLVSFVVSPEGLGFYEEVKRAQGEPIERVEVETRNLLSRDVATAHPEAVAKWREAEDLLWRPDAEEQLGTIGHKCREALQAFAQSLYEIHCPDSDPLPKEKTLNKIRAVLGARRASLGKKTERFLTAYWETVDAYWETVNDLAERAEHGSQRKDRPLVWEDARRLVFQTLLVMVELAAATRP